MSRPAIRSQSTCPRRWRRSRRARISRSISSMRTTTSSSSTSRRGWSCIRPPGHESGTLVNALIAHCGASLSGIGGVTPAGHRAPARQGHHRADGGRQERPGASIADRAIRRPRPHRADAARLHGLRLGRARPPARHGRRADRPASLRPRKNGGAPGRTRGGHPLGIAGSAIRGATASRSPRCSPASSRPGGPIRSGCTSPISATP